MIGERWGVTHAEVQRRYPCDEMAPVSAVQLWRGVTVNAPATAVWPWLCQLRLAPYSYDWLDNLGHRSPRELRDLPDPQPGERFSCVAGRFGVGRVVSVLPGSQLTARVMGAVMSYVLSPEGAGIRLLLKIVLNNARWYALPLAVGDWPMARRQLRNLKQRAEEEWTSSHRDPSKSSPAFGSRRGMEWRDRA